MKSGLSYRKGTLSTTSNRNSKACSLGFIVFSVFIIAFVLCLSMSSFVITMIYDVSNNQQQQVQEERISEEHLNEKETSSTSLDFGNNSKKLKERNTIKQTTDEKILPASNDAANNQDRELIESIRNSYINAEENFMKTIKSCIPTSMRNKIQQKSHFDACVERKKYDTKRDDNNVRSSGKTINRVGILAPPGKIGDAFFTLIKEVIDHITLTTKLSEDIKLERDTHVPPYGYGGNHGWTKVIRLLEPLKISLGEVCSEFGLLGNLQKNNQKLAVFRQIIRWHCRLSHFAAHTALITVNTTDLIVGNDRKSPDMLLNDIASFIIGPDYDHSKLKHFSMRKDFHEPYTNLKTTTLTTVQNVEDEIKKINKQLAEGQYDAAGIELTNIIEEELYSTNHLGDWPCKSFLSFDKTNNLQYDEDLRSIARLLSPNCNSNFVKCTIDIDKCEVKAESACS